jgi:hypothetical protein
VNRLDIIGASVAKSPIASTQLGLLASGVLTVVAAGLVPGATTDLATLGVAFLEIV